MACIESQKYDSPYSVKNSMSTPQDYSWARRPALVPTNPSFSLAEAEELVGKRIQRPLLPPPNPQLFRQMEFTPPPKSNKLMEDSSSPGSQTRESNIPFAFGFGCSVYRGSPVSTYDSYPRYQYIEMGVPGIDCLLDEHGISVSSTPQNAKASEVSESADVPTGFAPKRKHTAFVKEQYRRCFLEDRAGTPHPGEIEDDDTTPQLGVEDFTMCEISGKSKRLDSRARGLQQGRG